MSSSFSAPPDDTGSLRVDRTAFSIGRMEDQTAEYVASWRSRPPEERIAAVQFMRTIMYGHDAASGRLQRVLADVDALES